jgi:hypothetical protein
MSLKALGAALSMTGLPPLEKLVLVFLADDYTDATGLGRLPREHPGEVIARWTGATPAEAVAAVKALFEGRYLHRVEPPTDLLFPDEDPGGIWFRISIPGPVALRRVG